MKPWLVLLGLFCSVSFAVFADSNRGAGPHIEVALLSEHKHIVPGETQYVGILLSPEKEWHTYWRNAGDSGESPAVEWSATQALSYGDILWPLPEVIPVAHLVNYGYSDDNLLMVPVTSEANISAEEVTITADLSWLVCKEDCIPGWATLSLTLPVSQNASLNDSSLSRDAKWFKQTRDNLPENNTLEAKHETTPDHLAISVAAPAPGNWNLLPFRSDVIQHNTQQIPINKDGELTFLLPKSDYFSISDESINFLLTNGKSGYYVSSALNLSSALNVSANQSDHSLAWLLLLAFIGGLILNIMPCVLPVLAMKALSLSHIEGKSNDKANDKAKWGYPIGVILSFLLFAALIIIVKSSGSAIGWGFHMQEPFVIAFLAFLFVFIALMLLDVAPTGANFSGIGQSLAQKQGFTGQLFTGVLAVVVASPCTAPFMATALGFAMVSPPIETIAIFLALAIGFALPMTLVSHSPKFASWIPKPGAWMETFRQFLVFPMLATVIWLLWVFQSQVGGAGQIILLTGLLIFSLLLWVSSKSRGLWTSAILVAALMVGALISSKAIDFAKPDVQNTVNTFSENKLKALREQGEIVLVNMTADWCITCKVNEQVAFNDNDFEKVIAQDSVHYLVGDWTNKNQEIHQFLTRYQRSGVPLYVVYAGTHYEQVLPQVLTTDIVVDAINQAKQELKNATL